MEETNNITPHGMTAEETGAVRPSALVIGGTGMVRSLGEAGIPLIVGSDIADNPSLYSRFSTKRVMFHDYLSPEFIGDLIALGKSAAGKLVYFADDDRSLLMVSRHREELAPYYRFKLPPKEIVEGVLDKRQFSGLAQSLGLPVPKTFLPKHPGEIEQYGSAIRYPCILKPTFREDWWHPDFVKLVGPYKKVIYCNDRDELIGTYKKIARINGNVLVQEVIEGTDNRMFNIDMYTDERSVILAHYIYHKHRTYPIHAGIGCFVETIEDPEILEISKTVAAKLGMVGFCNIQYKRDSVTGALMILEIHTRASIWGYLGTVSGLNLLAFGYHQIAGLRYPHPVRYTTGVKSIDLKRDLRALPHYLKIHEWSLKEWVKSLRGIRSFHLLSLNDPLPFFADIWFIIYRQLKRKKFRQQ